MQPRAKDFYDSDNPDLRALTIHLSSLAIREMFHYLANSYESGAKYINDVSFARKKFCYAEEDLV